MAEYYENKEYKKILILIADIREDVEDPYIKDKLDNLIELIEKMHKYIDSCKWRL